MGQEMRYINHLMIAVLHFFFFCIHIDLETQNMYVQDLIEQIYTLKYRKKPVVYFLT